MALAKGAKIGVIGLGRIAWMMEDDPLRAHPCTHVGAYLAHGAELHSGCDIDAERRALFGERYGVEPLYEDYREMLAAENFDAVSICAYATERHDMVLAALESGVKKIFCEKALATSLEEADAMVEAIAHHKAEVVVGHMRRWSRHYQMVKQWLDEGAIGAVQSVLASFSGSLLHTGTHMFDVLSWWFGQPVAVSGRLEREAGIDEQSGYRYGEKGFDDLGGYGQLLFADDVVVHVEGRIKDYFIFDIEIIGSGGRICIGNDRFALYRPAESTHMTGFSELAAVDQATAEVSQSRTEWELAVASLFQQGKKRNRDDMVVHATAADARLALEMAMAFYMSDEQQGRPVTFPVARRGIQIRSR